MRMINKILLSLIAVLCLDATVTAQNKQVSGTVTDPAGAPVVGATVLVEGTTIGSTTDASGHFSLNAPEDAKLNISFIGYEPQQVDVAGRTHIPVSLKEDSHTIDDVVVTAMGITRSEKTLGYSVSTVKSDELTKARDGNVLNALSGKVAGVNISSSSGTAGGSSRIIIRGQSSLGSSGQPLFVIDGMPVSRPVLRPGQRRFGTERRRRRSGQPHGRHRQRRHRINQRPQRSRRDGPLRCTRQRRRRNHHDEKRLEKPADERLDQLDDALRKRVAPARLPKFVCAGRPHDGRLLLRLSERLGPQDRGPDRKELPRAGRTAAGVQK